MVDAAGTTVYAYTSGGFLYTEDGPFANDTVTNLYSNRLRVGLALQQPSGVWTNGFGYDAAKRLTSVTSPAGAFNYTYDPNRQGEVVNLSLPNTSYITNTFDPVARLLQTFLNNSANTTLDSAAYGYNLAGQRTTFTNAAGTYVNYSYDPAGQLQVAASSVSSENRGYTYDTAWNLHYLTNNGLTTTFTVDGKNELSAAGTTSFSYDANGNMTNQSARLADTAYTYDEENRLSSAQVGTSLLTTFVYDGLGRLREQAQWTNSGGGGGGSSPPGSGGGGSWGFSNAVYYIYDGKRVIQERDTNNTPTVAYTRGNDLSGTLEGAGGIGGLLARSAGYSSGSFTSHTFYHADGNGNITYLVDGTQALAASYRYDAYGNTLSSSGTLASSNTYRFSSKEFIPTDGFYYYLYRFYDPNAQRWINRDPRGETGFMSIAFPSWNAIALISLGANPYEMVDNNPMEKLDPFGLSGMTTGRGKGHGKPCKVDCATAEVHCNSAAVAACTILVAGPLAVICPPCAVLGGGACAIAGMEGCHKLAKQCEEDNKRNGFGGGD